MQNDYSSVAYIKNALQINNTNYDVLIAQLITAVSAQFKNYLNGRELLETGYYNNSEYGNDAEIRNGNNSDYIRVYNRPIQSLYQITFGVNDLTQQVCPGSYFVFDPDTGIIKFKKTQANQQLFQGFQNIMIEYSGGYSSIPEDIQQAVAIQVNKLMFLYNQRNAFVDSIKVGDVTKTYSDAFTIANEQPLLGEVKSILDSYKDRSY